MDVDLAYALILSMLGTKSSRFPAKIVLNVVLQIYFIAVTELI